MTKNMIIKHCTNCDATLAGNHFQDWLPILEAGTKIKIHDVVPYLDMEYIKTGLNCGNCLRYKIEGTVTMVVFKWDKVV